MESTKKISSALLVLGELFLGVVFSLFTIWLLGQGVFDRIPLGDTYLEGFILFYAGISLIFFLAVLIVGVPGAIRNGFSSRIWKAIIYSIIFWLISLMFSALIASFSFVISIYILLSGIVIGFNFGLSK